MKNKAMLQFFSSILLIILGITLLILHICKVVPDGWIDSSFGFALITLWAYTGFFISTGIIGGGFYFLKESLT